MQHARKHFFFKTKIYFFFDEIGYFNTEFVSPQHKKYKLTLSHFKKYTKKINNIFKEFEKKFEKKKIIFENFGCLDENRIF